MTSVAGRGPTFADAMNGRADALDTTYSFLVSLDVAGSFTRMGVAPDAVVLDLRVEVDTAWSKSVRRLLND